MFKGFPFQGTSPFQGSTSSSPLLGSRSLSGSPLLGSRSLSGSSLQGSTSPRSPEIFSEEDFGEPLVETENSKIYYYGASDDEIIKIMPYSATSAREISFNKALKGALKEQTKSYPEREKEDPVFLLPRKDIRIGKDQIGLIYPFTEELSEEFDVDDVWVRMISILALLEKLQVVHLDFRPENLCLYNGRLLIRDFGNSYLLNAPTGFLPEYRFPAIQIRAPEFFDREVNILPNRPNQFLSSEFMTYYAPELRAVLHGAEFDCRADLWSLASWMEGAEWMNWT